VKILSSISYDTYLFQVKRVDEMFVIILKMTSLNLFGCKEVTIVYSDFNNQALNLAYIKLLAIIFSVVIYNFCTHWLIIYTL
jgi:hypothetical protein